MLMLLAILKRMRFLELKTCQVFLQSDGLSEGLNQILASRLLARSLPWLIASGNRQGIQGKSGWNYWVLLFFYWFTALPAETVLRQLQLQFFVLSSVKRELRFKSGRMNLRNESRKQSRGEWNPVCGQKHTLRKNIARKQSAWHVTFRRSHPVWGCKDLSPHSPLLMVWLEMAWNERSEEVLRKYKNTSIYVQNRFSLGWCNSQKTRLSSFQGHVMMKGFVLT